MLLNAFTRALRDGFPPARVAGLKAIAATAQFHSPEDAAARVVPAVGPLCIDAVHEVRASALACLEHFIKVLADYHLELERKAAVLQDSDAAATEPAPAPGSSSGGSLLNSFGWATAVSNLGLGRGGTADVGGNQPVVTAPTGPPPPADVARAIDVGSVSKQLDPPAPQAPASQCTARHDGTMFKDMADDAEVGELLVAAELLPRRTALHCWPHVATDEPVCVFLLSILCLFPVALPQSVRLASDCRSIASAAAAQQRASPVLQLGSGLQERCLQPPAATMAGRVAMGGTPMQVQRQHRHDQ